MPRLVEVKERRIADLEVLHELQSDGPTMSPVLNQALRRALPCQHVVRVRTMM